MGSVWCFSTLRIRAGRCQWRVRRRSAQVAPGRYSNFPWAIWYMEYAVVPANTRGSRHRGLADSPVAVAQAHVAWPGPSGVHHARRQQGEDEDAQAL